MKIDEIKKYLKPGDAVYVMVEGAQEHGLEDGYYLNFIACINIKGDTLLDENAPVVITIDSDSEDEEKSSSSSSSGLPSPFMISSSPSHHLDLGPPDNCDIEYGDKIVNGEEEDLIMMLTPSPIGIITSATPEATPVFAATFSPSHYSSPPRVVEPSFVDVDDYVDARQRQGSFGQKRRGLPTVDFSAIITRD